MEVRLTRSNTTDSGATETNCESSLDAMVNSLAFEPSRTRRPFLTCPLSPDAGPWLCALVDARVAGTAGPGTVGRSNRRDPSHGSGSASRRLEYGPRRTASAGERARKMRVGTDPVW